MAYLRSSSRPTKLKKVAILVCLGIFVFTLGGWYVFRPRMTTENHVFVFMNLCQENRLVDAERYLNQHPEIATDPKAINQGPALVAVAIFVEDPQAVDLLLEHGADINATDIGGQTALEMAILKGRLRVAKKLIDQGGKLGLTSHDVDFERLGEEILRATEAQPQRPERD